ncbi:MAG: hypothetical protein GF308_13490 [Candidatus Heimdallarchaeota archaeon]|nr:hypothetical protein [Candidatus Heimdallarchaeota archaeon]
MTGLIKMKTIRLKIVSWQSFITIFPVNNDMGGNNMDRMLVGSLKNVTMPDLISML